MNALALALLGAATAVTTTSCGSNDARVGREGQRDADLADVEDARSAHDVVPGRTHDAVSTDARDAAEGSDASTWVDSSSRHGDGDSSAPVDSGISLQTFPVEAQHASGSVATIQCVGSAGSTQLTCGGGAGDFTPGEGIVIVGGGATPAVTPITVNPKVSSSSAGSGAHAYCYVVATADSLRGITAPSPVNQACVSSMPLLGGGTYVAFDLSAVPAPSGPAPTLLYYVSVDQGAYTLFTVVAANAGVGDFGQRLGDFGGWPATVSNWDPKQLLPLKNEDLFTTVTAVTDTQIAIADPLVSDVSAGATVEHDDTDAVEATVALAEQADGGIVQFAAKSYNIQRPTYQWRQTDGSITYTHDITKTPWWAGPTYLYLDYGTPGHIHFEGAGQSSTEILGPPENSFSTFLCIGCFGPANRSNPKTYRIQPVKKGDTEVTLVTASDGASFHAGDDIQLYGQSFAYSEGSTPVVDDDAGTEGPNALNHFQDPNTIATVSGATLTLVYPASKAFFPDVEGDSFGIVNVEGATWHDIALGNLTMTIQNSLVGGARAYGIEVDSVTFLGYPTALFGDDGGNPRRHQVVQNSTWSFGNGFIAYETEDELDQLVDVQFLNNTIYGVAAPGFEGPSQGAVMYGTEGACQFVYDHNDFYNMEISFQDTTDDVISNNHFHNSFLNLGVTYDNGGNHSYINFASQASATVQGNTFEINASFSPPWVLKVGHFDSATIANNEIGYTSSRKIGVLVTAGGSVSGNTVSVPNASGSTAIQLDPDVVAGFSAPAFDVSNNVIVGGAITAVAVSDPEEPYAGHICIGTNSETITGAALTVANPANVTQACP